MEESIRFQVWTTVIIVFSDVVPYNLVDQHYRENCCLLLRRLSCTGKIYCRVQKLQWSWDYYGPQCQSQSTLSSTYTIFSHLIPLLKMEAPGCSRKLVPVYQYIWCHHRRVYIQQEIWPCLVIWMIKISITIISKEDKMLEYTIKWRWKAGLCLNLVPLYLSIVTQVQSWCRWGGRRLCNASIWWEW